MTDSSWYLYMLRLPSGALYTGITTDVMRRVRQHQAGKGAKALRGKGELVLAFHCQVGDRSTALKLEYQIKQLNKKQKERLVTAPPLSLEYLLPVAKND
ncbi:GIY-YIG nuclease family protein [Serratia sp. UGAL515B_01]|uniref:GIY-YIG nuclease family protein n=1 Tax=Serratia sp. UGAL515B_01 TaxID=2986763 RepID=UPI002953E917|nr:GIY-YIG nuclease family protein [Serratia sp. UGAL515B_01]WON77337.1 GIY-YIG nuclease family protein [Serratia sp. UGAL515B_01]